MIDEHGWWQRDPISDEECILICLNNAPCGTNKKQVARLVEKYGPTKRKEAPTYKGINVAWCSTSYYEGLDSRRKGEG